MREFFGSFQSTRSCCILYTFAMYCILYITDITQLTFHVQLPSQRRILLIAVFHICQIFMTHSTSKHEGDRQSYQLPVQSLLQLYERCLVSFIEHLTSVSSIDVYKLLHQRFAATVLEKAQLVLLFLLQEFFSMQGLSLSLSQECLVPAEISIGSETCKLTNRQLSSG